MSQHLPCPEAQPPSTQVPRWLQSLLYPAIQDPPVVSTVRLATAEEGTLGTL